MRKSLAAALCLSALLVGCKPQATGPFTTLMALERWHRADPANEHTMTGLISFRRNETPPCWKELDAFCGIHYGNWGEATEWPPSYGTLTMNIADRQDVTWPRDETGETGWEAADGSLAWDTGDALHVEASGDVLPGFVVDAVVPAQIELTSHDFRALAANQLHILRSQPLELRWAPTTGEVVVLILQFKSTNSLLRQRGLWCAFPAAPGSVSISTEHLGHLLPSSAELSTNIYVGGGSRQKQALDGADLEVFTFKNEAARIQIE